MDYQYLRLEKSNNVARITLCRPERANSLNIECARELLHVAQTCRDSDDVRAVVLAAEGSIFCAGGDIGAFSAAGENLPAELEVLANTLHEGIEVFSAMDAPVIAEINGTAAGAGMSLIAGTNLAYATTASKFSMAYTAIGLTPDGSSSWFLPRLIGWRRTEELMLTNRTLSAKEAADWGLLNACYEESGGLQDAVRKLAERLAQGPTAAFGRIRQMLEISAGRSLHDQLAVETQTIVDSARTADGQAGIKAFLAKEKPVFSGR